MNRDLVVNLIGRALNTMPRTVNHATQRVEPSDLAWGAARSQAFVEAAAMAAEHILGEDYMAAKSMLTLRVRDVRATWSPEDLRDGERVGKEATTILEDMLAAR